MSDISCALCGNVLGWKYVAAEEESQKYKVGKYILETKRVCSGTSWEVPFAEPDSLPPDHLAGGDVEFDSQDEDECEEFVRWDLESSSYGKTETSEKSWA